MSLLGGPTLVVDDDGAGVAEDDRERIFEPFARADGAAAPGSGLGLAIVAQQARDHGAPIAVERAPLGGARFSARFDQRRAAAARAAAGARQHRSASGNCARCIDHWVQAGVVSPRGTVDRDTGSGRRTPGGGSRGAPMGGRSAF